MSAAAVEPVDAATTLRHVLARRVALPTGRIHAGQRLAHDLRLAPLDVVQIVLALEDQLVTERRELPFAELASVATVGELGRVVHRWFTRTPSTAG